MAVARALIFEPAVLLMDEPLGALDKNLRTHLQMEFKQLQRQLGVTVIYVTHDRTGAHHVGPDRGDEPRAVEQVGTPAGAVRGARHGSSSPGSSARATRGRYIRPGQPTAVRSAWPAGRSFPAAAELAPGHRVHAERPSGTGGPGLRRGEAGTLRGRVVEGIYAGETIRYWVEAEGAGRLLAKRPNDRQDDTPARGRGRDRLAERGLQGLRGRDGPSPRPSEARAAAAPARGDPLAAPLSRPLSS